MGAVNSMGKKIQVCQNSSENLSANVITSVRVFRRFACDWNDGKTVVSLKFADELVPLHLQIMNCFNGELGKRSTFCFFFFIDQRELFLNPLKGTKEFLQNSCKTFFFALGSHNHVT